MQRQMTLQCTNCRQPFQTPIVNVIDVSAAPQLKTALLSGQLNRAQCPNCGASNSVLVPMLYHDASKELLIACVPMELNLNKDQTERAVGDLLNTLPKDNFKGYMFNPKRALTFQGMIDLILQADGVTPEMMAEQRARVDLLQRLIETPDDASLEAAIKASDSEINMEFLQVVTMMVQRMLQTGREDIAQQVLYVQNKILEHSTYGQEILAQQEQQEEVVREVADALNALGEDAQRSDFLDLVIRYQDSDAHIQAIVGLVRPVMDYAFFEELTARIGQAPADDRAALESLRDRLVEYTQVIDQQAQRRLQNAVGLLQMMVNAENLDEMIAENLPMIDDTFLSVLAANVEEMQRRGNIQASARLKEIYQRVVEVLQSQMQPELVFVNQLLSTENDDEAKQMIAAEAHQYGAGLLEVMDAVDQLLQQQGQAAISDRLRVLRAEVEAALAQ